MSVMRIFKDSLQKIMMFAGKRKSSIAFGWHDYRNLKFVSGHNEKLRVKSSSNALQHFKKLLARVLEGLNNLEL